MIYLLKRTRNCNILKNMKKIILSTTSPRRLQIFKILGIDFIAVPPKYEEIDRPLFKPKKMVIYNARKKAESLVSNYPHSVIIGVDTVVSYKNKTIGKPKNKTEAVKMLYSLNGTSHQVITGYCMIDTDTGKKITESVATDIEFKKMRLKDIDAYIKKEKPYKMAGGYDHEHFGAILLKRINGDYYNSIGLPLSSIFESLKKFNINVL